MDFMEMPQQHLVNNVMLVVLYAMRVERQSVQSADQTLMTPQLFISKNSLTMSAQQSAVLDTGNEKVTILVHFAIKLAQLVKPLPMIVLVAKMWLELSFIFLPLLAIKPAQMAIMGL